MSEKGIEVDPKESRWNPEDGSANQCEASSIISEDLKLLQKVHCRFGQNCKASNRVDEERYTVGVEN